MMKTFLFSIIFFLTSTLGITQLSVSGTAGNVSQVVRAGATGTFNGATVGALSAEGGSFAANSVGLNYLAPTVQYTNYLDLTNFNITVPTLSVITGIRLSYSRKKSSADNSGNSEIYDDEVRIIKAGIASPINRANNRDWDKSSFKTELYGGSTDLWGLGWVVSDFTAANFGVRISAKRQSNAGPSNQIPEIDFIQFTIFYNSTLPVELISFQGERLYNGARQLNWSTATEINSEKFLVQRRFNEDFRTIAEIKSVGNSSSKVDYSYADYDNTSDPILYYRLVQVDFNGDSKIYDVISIKNPGKDNFDVYPNPASDELHVRLDEESADKPYTFLVYDNKGTVVLNRIIFLSEIVNITNLNPGVYYVCLKHGEKSFENIKLIID